MLSWTWYFNPGKHAQCSEEAGEVLQQGIMVIGCSMLPWGPSEAKDCKSLPAGSVAMLPCSSGTGWEQSSTSPWTSSGQRGWLWEAMLLFWSQLAKSKAAHEARLGWCVIPTAGLGGLTTITSLFITTLKATSFDIPISVGGTAVKPHRTQPAWGEKDISEGSETLNVTLPREVVTSPLGNGEVLLGTSPQTLLESNLYLNSIYPLASLSALNCKYRILSGSDMGLRK